MTPSDLRALAARVEAGKNVRSIEFVNNFPLHTWEMIRAFSDHSLDACLALHEAVLGERWAWQVCIDPGCGAMALLDADEATADAIGSNAPVRGDAPTPARAWLAAILRALAAEREATTAAALDELGRIDGGQL